jgi:hypothetical protein
VSARYSGQKKAFTIDNYVEIHQNAQSTLAKLNEVVPNTKKVTGFLVGMMDLLLSNAKDLILGDLQKLQNFELCQKYVKTLVYNKITQEKPERQAASVQASNGSTSTGKRNLQDGENERRHQHIARGS